MRSYGEVIDVRTTAPALAEGAPEQFLWRGRLYLVRDVLAHWVELGAWWVAPGRTRRVDGTDGIGGRAVADDTAPRSVAADVGAVEREVWRVEASPGRSANPGVYDLVRDVPAAYDAREPDDPAAPGVRPGGHRPDLPSRWRLARALD